MISGVSTTASNRTMLFPDRGNDRGSSAFADLMAATADGSRKSSTASASKGIGISSAAIETNFDAWIRQKTVDGAGDEYLARVNGYRSSYLDVARKAESSGGYADPLGFVQGLDAGELAALQHTHSLADPIDPSTLTEEGALNLLLPGNMSRDVDKDGLTMIGKASMIVFPPNDAPQAFKDAWEKTTAGMDFGTHTDLGFSMWLQGRGTYNPDGTPGGMADYYKPGFDYRALVDRAIDSAEFNLRFQQTDVQKAHVARMLDGLQALRSNLSTSKA